MRASWGSLRPRVIDELQKKPRTVHDIANTLGASYRGVDDVVRMLRELNVVTVAGREASSGKPRIIYGLCA